MFARRYFPDRYFPHRYWPEGGEPASGSFPTAAMRQVFYCRNLENANQNNTQTFASPVAPNVRFGEDHHNGRHPWMCTGTFRNLRIEFEAVSDVQWTFTFLKNGIATALTCTIAAGSTVGLDVGHTVTVVPGDIIALRRDPSPGFAQQPSSYHPNFWMTLEFESASTGVSGYGTNANSAHSGSSTFYDGLFAMNDDVSQPVERNCNLVGPAGTLTSYAVQTNEAPNVNGTSCVYTVMRSTDNGATFVAQDGSGGTSDTRITLTSGTYGTWTGSVTLASGDLVAIRLVTTGFSAGQGVATAIGTQFTATTNGQFWLGGTDGATPSNTTVQYLDAVTAELNSNDWSSTETTRHLVGSITAVTCTGMWAWVDDAPGLASSGKSWTFNVRVNEADASGGPSVTISETQTANNTPTGSFVVSLGDTFGIKSTPAATPLGTSSGMAWVWVGVANSPPVIGPPDDEEPPEPPGEIGGETPPGGPPTVSGQAASTFICIHGSSVQTFADLEGSYVPTFDCLKGDV